MLLILSALRLPFSDVPAPAPQQFNDLGGNSRSQWDSQEDKALMDCVCKRKLCPYA